VTRGTTKSPSWIRSWPICGKSSRLSDAPRCTQCKRDQRCSPREAGRSDQARAATRMKLVAKRVGRTIGKPTVLSELPNSDHTESVPSVRPPSLVAQIGGLPGDWWHENQAPMRAASSFRVGRVRSVMCVAAGPASGPASGLGSVALSQGPGSMVALAPSTGPRASGWPGVPAAPQQKSCNSPWLPRGRPPGEAEGPADSGELKLPLGARAAAARFKFGMMRTMYRPL
jgi:hypothetical protein